MLTRNIIEGKSTGNKIVPIRNCFNYILHRRIIFFNDIIALQETTTCMNTILSYNSNYINMIFTDATLPESIEKFITEKLIELEKESEKSNADIKLTTTICREIFGVAYDKGHIIEKIKLAKSRKDEHLAVDRKICKYCGLSFGGLPQLFLHIQKKHFDLIEQKVSILIFKYFNTIINTSKIILMNCDVQYL